MPTSRLAKLSPPRASQWSTRVRLHRLLDEATSQSVVWIAAGPGCGKSTLAACWAAGRGPRTLWYRVDPGDVDPGAAFGYLAQLAGKRRMPTYQPQELERLDTFARSFFRAFFAAIPAASTLVIDDAHAATGSDFDVLLAAAVREVPPDVSLLILSRREPAGALLEDVARGGLRLIEDEVLAFSTDEAADLLAGTIDPATAGRWRQQVGGWAAGLLFLAGGGSSAMCDTRAERPALERIDAFFAERVLAQLSDEDRRVLAAAALLPDVDARTLQRMGCGNGEHLERLRRQRSFVTRLDREPSSWRIHDLLREALLRRIEDFADPAWLSQVRRTAAAAAAERGLVRDAVTLLLQEGDEAAALSVADQAARRLVRTLRLGELAAIASALGSATRRSLPLSIALAEAAWQRNDARSAVAGFEHAYRLLDADQLSAPGLLIAAGAIAAILEGWQDFDGTAVWMQRLVGQMPARADIVDATDGVRIDSACLQATNMIWGQGQIEPGPLVQRLLGALRADDGIDPNVLVAASSVMLEVAGYRLNDATLFREVVAASAAVLQRPELSPLVKAGWLVTHAPLGRRWPSIGVRLPATDPVAELEMAVELGRANGGRGVAFSAALFLAHMAVATNDRSSAGPRLTALREFVDETRPRQAINVLEVESNVLALHGDWPAARRVIARARALADQHGFPSSQMWNIEVYEQRLAIAAGDAVAARATLLANAERYPAGSRRDFALILADVAAAAQALRTEGSIPQTLVRAILERARVYDWPGFCAHLTPIAARLCADALAAGIEPEFARRTVMDRHLPPPSAYEPHWPWPLRIRALGGFTIEAGGEPLPPAPRAQRKPLDLLKLLVARGPQPVDASVALDALWPEADGAAARASFDMTVMRLRKLLSRHDAVHVDASHVGLDTRIVWVDAFAFASGASDEYPGSLFGAAAVQPWWAAAREKLHQRFLRRTAERGRTLLAAGCAEAALEAFEAGLAQDPLAEELYQGAIRCHLAAGRQADALRTFRRCREQLSIVLGVSPAASTLALVEGLSRR